ncbi:Uma2 family endonuclease [Gemmata sp. JC717]|uniref:Uma2 family endonuclease n=1 Tax=Gemmata algarum TaxID=2975278 RepID=UPI0021BB5D3C|nr:Uma2 family endonuclease [Gemmata algarum]MDY3555500.1 Uma2 family endonuclease [Gemmata algarum]
MSIAEAPVVVSGPTHLDLPETDGKPVENAFEHPQSALLSDVLLPVLTRLHPDDNYFVGADTGIYWYHAKPNPLDGCKSPDWYYVPNVPRLLGGELRRSYVYFQEGSNPLVVVEYVSGSGDDERDRTPITGKFWVYEHAIAATFYVIWDTPRNVLEVYELIRGSYRRLDADANGWVRIRDMDISLGLWHGEYHGYTTNWLRAWDREGHMLPTAGERAEAQRRRAEAEKRRAEAEKQRAETEKQRAETEKQRAEKLAARLRALGVDPDSV